MNYISSPECVFELLKSKINPRAEELWTICLNPQGRLLSLEMIFRGTIDMCPSHPREIFRAVISHGSSSFIICHNHPSGDPTPSPQDLALTNRISRLAKLFEISLGDHIIIGKDNFTSLRRQGFFDRSPRKFKTPN
jgi:DNA repair protein RadC